MIFDTISVKARWEPWCRWNCDLRVINAREKKAFSVVPKASPWRPNHVIICLLRHSGESLQNGQLELRRRKWYFARETVRQDFERVPEHRVSFDMRYSMGFAKSHSLKCSLHKWAWCGTARKSARFNCINLKSPWTLILTDFSLRSLLWYIPPTKYFHTVNTGIYPVPQWSFHIFQVS